jgi:hypothetical protein
LPCRQQREKGEILTVTLEISHTVGQDVLPQHARQPIRIDLFGEEVEERASVASVEIVLVFGV